MASEDVDVLLTAVPSISATLTNLGSLIEEHLAGVSAEDWARLRPVVDALHDASDYALTVLDQLDPDVR